MIELLLQAERALSVGLIDQAERLYGQAAEADPRNGIAVVGLARVALERGDERGAYATALRALEIDPDNQAARRLVDRLAEVMRYRGEEVPSDAGAATPAAPDPPVAATDAASSDRPAPRGLIGRLLRRRR